MKRILPLLVVIILKAYTPACAQNKNLSGQDLGLVPLPLELKVLGGEFTLPENILIYAKSNDEVNIAGFIKDFFIESGKSATITSNKAAAQIYLSSTSGLADNNPEAYELAINKEGIKIQASTGGGLFYGSQTLMQILSLKNASLNVPYVSIKDKPTFKWRGMMLDVSRHFFSVAFIKKFIDYFAAYKLNTFHWHLTDDQGWRIEIKKYPKLTQIGAFRKETIIGAKRLMKKPEDIKFDGIPYGGFYTQEQIKEVVKYAQKRYITIIPEIEMPGHSRAVLAAYPELACKPGPYETMTSWGISLDIVCPSEQTFQFFENVLNEVVQLFPGEYVHIGGDEAKKDRWRESKLVTDIMKRENFSDVEKVQGWFNTRIEKYLHSKGKKLIGWGEILEGGITPTTAVMSWRGDTAGIKAARQGNNVVMSPSTHLYFNQGQNPIPNSLDEPLMIGKYLPLEKVYSYNPYSSQITQDQHKYILGVQANLWTEYISNPQGVEYMLFPRLLALSEIAWTPYANKNYDNFLDRIGKQFTRLDAKNIFYRVPEPVGLDSSKIVRQGDKAIITLTSLVPGAQIRYTLDGHTPDETTNLYTKPIIIPIDRGIKLRVATITPSGRRSVPSELVIK